MPLGRTDAHDGENSPRRGLTDLAERAVLCTPGSCAAAVTLTDGRGGPSAGAPHSAAVSHPDVSALVAVQWERGEGPLPEALEADEPLVAADLLSDTRWSLFRAMALQRGLRGCATLPFRSGGAVLTVSVYSFRPHRLSHVVHDAGPELAQLAAGFLARVRR